MLLKDHFVSLVWQSDSSMLVNVEPWGGGRGFVVFADFYGIKPTTVNFKLPT